MERTDRARLRHKHASNSEHYEKTRDHAADDYFFGDLRSAFHVRIQSEMRRERRRHGDERLSGRIRFVSLYFRRARIYRNYPADDRIARDTQFVAFGIVPQKRLDQARRYAAAGITADNRAQ